MADTETAGLVEDEERAQLSTADINDLPDSAFAYIEPGGEKDDEGKTTPRSLRHFPIHDAEHVRNALARAPQSPFGSKAMPKILAAAKKFGVEVSDEQKTADEELERRRLVAEQLGRKMIERRSLDTGPIEVRSQDDGKLHVTGYASVFGRKYDMGHYQESVRPGAFRKSLAEGAQVHLLLNHAGLPLASTMNGTLGLSEDGIGLRYEAVLDPDDPDSQAAVRKIQSGLLQQSSFAFMPIRQNWSSDYTERELVECSIDRGDVSIVNFGASPHTSVSARAALEDFERAAVRYAADIVDQEQRAGASISGERLAKLNGVLRLIADADRNLDQAQPELADIIGVVNPDDDETAEPGERAAAEPETRAGGGGMGDGCCDDCSDDCDGSCCDACMMGGGSLAATPPVEYTRYDAETARIDIEGARYAPRSLR